MLQLRRRVLNMMVGCSVVGLSACAYTVETSHQDITFTTPGAEYAQCDVFVDKLRYQVNPPQKLNIMKSGSDMEVHCVAPGNRVKSITVPSSFASRTVWGTPAGMAWDYASDTMFSYPSVIAVDFSQEAIVANQPPRHNSAEIAQPEDYNLEEYLPGEPRLNSDRFKKPQTLQRRDDLEKGLESVAETPINEPKALTPDKSDLEKTVPSKAPPAIRPAVKNTAPAIKPVPHKSAVIPLPEEPALEDQMQGIKPQAGTASPAQPAAPSAAPASKPAAQSEVNASAQSGVTGASDNKSNQASNAPVKLFPGE